MHHTTRSWDGCCFSVSVQMSLFRDGILTDVVYPSITYWGCLLIQGNKTAMLVGMLCCVFYTMKGARRIKLGSMSTFFFFLCVCMCMPPSHLEISECRCIILWPRAWDRYSDGINQNSHLFGKLIDTCCSKRGHAGGEMWLMSLLPKGPPPLLPPSGSPP